MTPCAEPGHLRDANRKVQSKNHAHREENSRTVQAWSGVPGNYSHVGAQYPQSRRPTLCWRVRYGAAADEAADSPLVAAVGPSRRTT